MPKAKHNVLEQFLKSLTFPAELPISAHFEAVKNALRDHQVVIICGETGSGKSTQLPKMVLRSGVIKHGEVGCTQPRRIAAMTLARRVAAETGSILGSIIGYQHRFERKASDDTVIKFMTDGILLNEIRTDRLLKKYDALIVDEAHERTLNIDFILGYLKTILPRRPDLRVIVSSATLEVDRFSKFFNDAPIIQIEGRLYPIDIRYRAPESEDVDMPAAIADAVEEFGILEQGDILAFLPGERDIRDVRDELIRRFANEFEIIPLLASLPAAEQQRAFNLSNKRRVILATNVAETSVTIPGIRCVIDTGLARISRYHHRTQVQRLQIEPISQASAKQRSGRCGRIGPGICLRLYAETDLHALDKQTPPEIRRTSLAGVILNMLEIGLGDIAAFPFIDPPSATMINEGINELLALGAVTNENSKLSMLPLGRKLVRFPLEPRLARMLLAANEERALSDAIVVIAALALDDPRRRPIDRQEEADKLHRRFLTAESDFAALLRLWRWFKGETEGKSQSAVRRLCRDNFLSYPRMRDWIDLVERIETLSKQMGLDFQKNKESNDSLHKSLLAGLLGRIGRRDKETGEYRGAHGIRFLLFPGSGLVKLGRDAEKKNSKNSLSPEKVSSREKSLVSRDWVMAGELMETSRLFARIAAYINPAWIEEIAAHLCKRAYYSPFWDAQNGYARIMERVTFNGFTLADGRKKDLSRIAPSEARDMLMQCGLAEGQIINPPQFLKANLARIRKIQDIEEKTRRTGQLVDCQKIIEFYNKRLPDQVCTVNELRRWIKSLTRDEVDTLYMRESDFMVPDHLAQGFPDCIVIGDIKFPLRYRHSSDDREDGITCVSRVEHLTLLRAWPHDWLVPGAVDHKISWMLLALPAKIRRQLQPIEQTVNICRHKMDYGKGALAESLALVLRQEWDIEVTPSIWAETKMPAYLRIKFQAINSDGKVLGQSRDLDSLIKLYCPDSRAKDGVRKNHQQRWQRDNITTWDCEDLPVSVNLGTSTMPIINYPALADMQTSVSLRLFQDKINAHGEHLAGVCRLLLLGLDKTASRIFNTQLFPKPVLKWLQNNGFAHDSMIDDIARTVIRRVGLDEKEEVRDAAVFEQRLKLCSQNVGIVYTETFRLINAILHAVIELEKVIEKLPSNPETDLHDALACLLFPGFVWSVAWSQLKHYPRYLEGMRWRCERYALDPVADARRQTLFAPYWQRYADFIVIDDKAPYDAVALDNYRWLLEEYRVSLFAQSLGTAVTVSPKRLDAAWEQVLK